MTLFTLYRLLLVATLSLQVHTSCFYPDGTYIAPDTPCSGNGTQESFSCGPGTICLSDKVCYNPNAKEPYTYVRGSCTDQTFKSSACPQFCLTPENNAATMYKCGERTDSYCCSPDNTPCSCEFGNVTLGDSSSDVTSIISLTLAISTTTSGLLVELSTATSIIEIVSYRTTTTAERTASPLSGSTQPHLTVVPSPTTTNSISAPSSETVKSTESSSPSHVTSKEGAAIGAPIAILSVIVIFLVALLIRQQRRTQSTTADTFSEAAKRNSSAHKSAAQQRWEVPAGIAATEMEAPTKRSELVA